MGRARGGLRSISTGERRRVVDDYGATDPFGDLFGAGRGGRAWKGSTADATLLFRERQHILTDLIASIPYTIRGAVTLTGPDDRYAVIGFKDSIGHEQVIGVCANQADVFALAERTQRRGGYRNLLVVDLDAGDIDCTIPISYDSRTNRWACDLEDHRS